MESRDRLTTDELFGTTEPGIVHNVYYAPQGELTTFSHSLCGTLHFSETLMTTAHPDSDWKGSGQSLFPAFSIPFVTWDGWLIPFERDIILSGMGAGDNGRSFWNVIVNPGHVWQEASDSGYARAAFPFTLTDNYTGQARNGLATFVLGSTDVSSVAIQITQETAPIDDYIRADFSAMIPVTSDLDCPANVESVISEFENELASRLPLLPWSDLTNALSTQARSRSGFADTDFSMVALLMNEQLYMQDVGTRSGLHPMPAWMRHGVYSVTKTMGLGVSMFYLAGRYGDSVFDELITDHVPQLADHPGWQGVTFHHTLNMVTGNIGAEKGAPITPYMRARSSASKILAISELADAPPAPGVEFAYYSTHSFVLSFAMNNYVKAREGAAADYWTMVQRDVLKPIGIFYLPISRSIEEGGVLGTPIMGWGSYPDVDAVAKVASLLQHDGEYDGQQLLSRTKTREAMRRMGEPGYDTGHPIERYLHSVWTVRTDAGACDIDVPLMSGHGGNHVMMLPSGLSMIRFMDSNDYEVWDTVRVAESYRTSC
jgi:hypothetical protein